MAALPCNATPRLLKAGGETEAGTRPCDKAYKAHLLTPLATLYHSAQSMLGLRTPGIWGLEP